MNSAAETEGVKKKEKEEVNSLSSLFSCGKERERELGRILDRHIKKKRNAS